MAQCKPWPVKSPQANQCFFTLMPSKYTTISPSRSLILIHHYSCNSMLNDWQIQPLPPYYPVENSSRNGVLSVRHRRKEGENNFITKECLTDIYCINGFNCLRQLYLRTSQCNPSWSILMFFIAFVSRGQHTQGQIQTEMLHNIGTYW